MLGAAHVRHLGTGRPDRVNDAREIFGAGMLGFAFGLMAMLGIWKLAMLDVEAVPVEPVEDIDRARFMLECTHDWMMAPDDCRAVLRGEDPPASVDGC